MIDMETVKFIALLEKLAEKSYNGIVPFAEATVENAGDLLFYDADRPDEDGNYPVVQDITVTDGEDGSLIPGIAGYFGDSTDSYEICAVVDEDGMDPTFLLISIADSDDQLVVEDGRWYVT